VKKGIASVALCLSLTQILGVPAAAQEEAPPLTAPVQVNEEAAEFSAVIYQDGTSYLPFAAAAQALRPDAQTAGEEGKFTASASDFTMTVQTGACYLEVNGRYLYIPDRVRSLEDGTAMVPTRVLAAALGASVDWNGTVSLTSGENPMRREDRPYTDEELDLLARLITHESGYEPFLGKLAVGSVVMNRVADKRFPNSVTEVICAKNQFPGATDSDANTDSTLAARLVLEGANVAQGAYWFNRAGVSCWASRNKALLYTIGNQAFYG